MLTSALGLHSDISNGWEEIKEMYDHARMGKVSLIPYFLDCTFDSIKIQTISLSNYFFFAKQVIKAKHHILNI